MPRGGLTSERARQMALARHQRDAETYADVRARRLTALALKAELEAAALQGRLIEKRPALRLVQQLAQAERDALLAWCARGALAIAAELRADVHRVQTVLEREVREHLRERAEIGNDALDSIR